VRALRIYEGTTEIQRVTIAGELFNPNRRASVRQSASALFDQRRAHEERCCTQWWWRHRRIEGRAKDRGESLFHAASDALIKTTESCW